MTNVVSAENGRTVLQSASGFFTDAEYAAHERRVDFWTPAYLSGENTSGEVNITFRYPDGKAIRGANVSMSLADFREIANRILANTEF